MGQKLNTKYNDYVPVITPDESMMFFTSRRPGGIGNIQDEKGNYYEDVYLSRKTTGGWSEPVNVGAPVNSNDHDACVAIAPDGKHMILYRPSADKLSGDLYETVFDNNAWGIPVKLGPQINTKDGKETSACISADGNLLFFSSDKPGGFGGKDLYVSIKLPNGKWGLPVNLGPSVNTPYDEDAPFMSPDNTTLYFSSKGHETIGEYDVFKTQRSEDGKGWTIPENMGYPVNSVGDDIFFVICADGYHGYYSSQKDNGFGGEDLYMIDMHYSENDVKVREAFVYEKGSNEGKTVKAKITLNDGESRQPVGFYTSNQRSGKFIFMVSPFRTYSVHVEADGYESVTIPIEALTPENEQEPVKIELTKK